MIVCLYLAESTIKNDNLTPKAKALFDFDGEYEDELSVRVSAYCSVWSGIGRRDSPVVRVLGCGSRGLSASPGWVDCVVFWDETLYSHSTSLCLTQVFKRVRWTSIGRVVKSNQEPATTPYSCHDVFTDRSIFSLNLSRIQILSTITSTD